MEKISPLQALRLKYDVKLPTIYKNGPYVNMESTVAENDDAAKMASILTNTLSLPYVKFSTGAKKEYEAFNTGVILSGGQAPGGHNVIAGLFDALKSLNSDNKLIGFLGGPSGLLNGKFIEITDDLIDDYRNTGGFDIIGSGRTKLETKEQFDASINVLEKNSISSLVIIGGDDSNTNAAMLAEYILSQNKTIKVVGCPKTIDGDLKNEYIEASFGFDTATKVYSELIGNIARDANSAKKYWHFIKLMGRSASHIALECGLKTQANITLISEEVADKKMTLNEIVKNISQQIAARAENKENFGLVLIPEGIIEFIPEMNKLIAKLNDILAVNSVKWEQIKTNDEKFAFIKANLTSELWTVYHSLPDDIALQLVLDRDPHGNVQVSRIETDKLLVEMVGNYLRENYPDVRFSSQHHFFGYEGRCAAPSNFDADYGYNLGYTAAVLLANGKSAYMASIKQLQKDTEDWIPGGVPISMMMTLEKRHGEMKPVIKKALVELDGKAFKKLEHHREEWGLKTQYLYPGPIQYFGSREITDIKTETLMIENS